MFTKCPPLNIPESYTITSNTMMNKLDEIVNYNNKITQGNPEKIVEDFQTFESFKKYFSKYSDGENLAEGFKNHFRHGKSTTPKVIEVSGETLLKKSVDMKKYLVEYDKIVVPKMTNKIKAMQQDVKKLKTQVENIVNESFCYLENTSYDNTELANLPNRTIVMEADTNEKEKVSQTSVSVSANAETDETTDEQKEESKKMAGNVINMCKSITQILKLIYGSALSVFEEKYLLYISIYKTVLNNSTAKKEDEKKEVVEEEEKTTPPPNEASKTNKKKTIGETVKGSMSKIKNILSN